jgi:hypothetical protein
MVLKALPLASTNFVGGMAAAGPGLNLPSSFFGDVGFFGPDKGKGGKFLLLPPGYKGTVPKGYFVYRSATKNVFVFLRAFYRGQAGAVASRPVRIDLQ